MSETVLTTDPVIVPKRKYAARRKKRAAPAQRKPAAPSEFAGLTPAECPVACNASGCIISGKSYCGHPRKGGLQGEDISNPAALDRAARAKRALAHASIEKRDK